MQEKDTFLKTKVSMDPVHGEIHLFPLELLCSDTWPIQRLRAISQLAGAQKVFPGATHNRFLHSLGVMHISGEYSKHLNFKSSEDRTIRLAGLTHDIGHGPYSHQFDEVAYRRAGLLEGHDQQRERILLEVMPEEMLKVFSGQMKSQWQEQVMSDIKLCLGSKPQNEEELKEAFLAIMKKVKEVFDGEKNGSAFFNIVQGPLGADRTDFVMRDAYYCGTKEFGSIDLQRIIRNSFLIKKENIERLAYDSKIIDNIYSVLFGRFMMYKNVYFHKTARAADLMLQKILELSYDTLKLEERINDPKKFLKLTEEWVGFEINRICEENIQNNISDKPEIEEANQVMKDYNSRRLWKLLLELSFSITGIDPSAIAKKVGQAAVESLEKNIRDFLGKNNSMSESERNDLQCILENSTDFFVIDAPYKLSLAHPNEFLANHVYLNRTGRDDKGLVNFEEYLKNNPFYKTLSGNLVQIVRVYITKDDRDLLFKYSLIPSVDGLNLTTRW